jgi:hypothetical protein
MVLACGELDSLDWSQNSSLEPGFLCELYSLLRTSLVGALRGTPLLSEGAARYVRA